MRKVIIGLESRDRVFARARNIAERIDAGEFMQEADYHLNFADMQQLFNGLTLERMHIIQALLNVGKQTLEELAQCLGRDYGELKNNIDALIAFDLIVIDELGFISMPWKSVEFPLSEVISLAESRDFYKIRAERAEICLLEAEKELVFLKRYLDRLDADNSQGKSKVA